MRNYFSQKQVTVRLLQYGALGKWSDAPSLFYFAPQENTRHSESPPVTYSVRNVRGFPQSLKASAGIISLNKLRPSPSKSYLLCIIIFSFHFRFITLTNKIMTLSLPRLTPRHIRCYWILRVKYGMASTNMNIECFGLLCTINLAIFLSNKSTIVSGNVF
jgi:hypothetical protein